MGLFDFLSPTGRLKPFQPEPLGFDNGVFMKHMDEMQTVIGDFAATERRIVELLRKQSEDKLLNWILGQEPNLKLNIELDNRGYLYAVWNGSKAPLGANTEHLERLGYTFTFTYKRDYVNGLTDEVVRLWPRQVRSVLPEGVFITNSLEQVHFDLSPLPTGGESYCLIHAPTGHYGVGVSMCRPDEIFNKKVGRTLAAQRAFQDLNEVVNG